MQIPRQTISISMVVRPEGSENGTGTVLVEVTMDIVNLISMSSCCCALDFDLMEFTSAIRDY